MGTPFLFTLLIFIFISVVLLLFLQFRGKDMAAQTQIAVLSEKIAQIEQTQKVLSQSAQSIEMKLAQSGVMTNNLSGTAETIRTELSRARDSLTELQTQAKTRVEMEQQTAESIQRVEMVLAGTKSRGKAGENIVETVFSRLPSEWQVRSCQIGNKTVEFALRLPNNLVLPIDSKWTGTDLLEKFSNSQDLEEQKKLIDEMEKKVAAKAQEVKKYIHPDLTPGFGLAVLPDPVYELTLGIHAEIYHEYKVILVSYTLFLPYVLLIFNTVLKTSKNLDLEKLNLYLQTVQDSLKEIGDTLESHFSKALVMLNNFQQNTRSSLSKASSALTRLQGGSGPE